MLGISSNEFCETRCFGEGSRQLFRWQLIFVFVCTDHPNRICLLLQWLSTTRRVVLWWTSTMDAFFRMGRAATSWNRPSCAMKSLSSRLEHVTSYPVYRLRLSTSRSSVDSSCRNQRRRGPKAPQLIHTSLSKCLELQPTASRSGQKQSTTLVCLSIDVLIIKTVKFKYSLVCPHAHWLMTMFVTLRLRATESAGYKELGSVIIITTWMAKRSEMWTQLKPPVFPVSHDRSAANSHERCRFVTNQTINSAPNYL